MKYWFLLLIGLAACVPQNVPAGPSPAATEPPAKIEAPALPDLGPAPELQNEIWLNVDRPLRLSELRGKVVLLEMWTFG